MLPASLLLENGVLPDTPGVYLFKKRDGTVLYVGKATSLKRRASQHFERPHNRLIEEMTRQAETLGYLSTASALEALILEANLIKAYFPPFNTRDKDDKSFSYLVFTREPFPKPLLVRGNDLHSKKNAYLAVYGPYTSVRSLRAALDWLRRIFPWSTCEHAVGKACFSSHIGLCPGVCIGRISQADYRRIIRDLMAFFEGKKGVVLRRIHRDMLLAAKEQRFENAAQLRGKVFALEHIKDVALLKREDDDVSMIDTRVLPVEFFGRIEGYDISHVSGSQTVASMVVFEGGEPAKGEYRKFRLRTIDGPNDVASIKETLMRRLRHAEWPRPNLFLIDGGLPQVRAAEGVLHALGVQVPVIGLAKGPTRKKLELVCTKRCQAICYLAQEHLLLLARVRDEAHRFAIAYHRERRRREFLPR